MSRDALISRAIAFVDEGAEPEHLERGAVLEHSPEWVSEAHAHFGSWDTYLAACFVHLRNFYEALNQRAQAPVERSEDLQDVPRPERKIGIAAQRSSYVVTRSGYVFVLPLDQIPASEEPRWLDWPDGPGSEHVPESLHLGDEDGGVLIFGSQGSVVAIDERLLPQWGRDAIVRPLRHRFDDLGDDEVFVHTLPRRQVRAADRMYTMTALGQIKATDASEYKRVGTAATVGLKFKSDDYLVSAFAGATDASVCMASSLGKALVFDTSDIRSQGRRATGVRGIGLDPGARTVGAFEVDPTGFCVLATRGGLFKRMQMDHFRPQGRAGNGLQTYRLTGDEEVVAMNAVDIAGDILIISSKGRVARFPSYDVPLRERAARGESLLSFEGDEYPLFITGVPAGAFQG